jgi:hypothetical protein
VIKVKVTCNWSSNEEIKKRLIDQFGNEDSLLNFEIISEGYDYDLIIAFGYITEPPINGKPIFVFPQEPSWSGGHQKYFNTFENVKVFGFNETNYSPVDIVTETVAHMFYGGRGPWEEGDQFWNYQNIINFNGEKTKSICSFVSNRGMNEESFPVNCLYKERLDLVSMNHSKLPFVDFYGWGNKDNLKPHVGKKWDSLKDYKFCLSIENSNERNYVSEKFYDCILTNTVPIYFGCSNIIEFWPQDGYILLENITDHKYVIEKLNWVNNNIDDLYKEMLPKLLEMKKRYFNDFNLIKKIKKEYYEL